MSGRAVPSWEGFPLASRLAKVEAAFLVEGGPPVTAEAMVQALASDQGGLAPGEVVALPDYSPIPLPAPAPTLVSAVGDQGSVGSTLKTVSDFLHPAKAPEAPVKEVVLWARKWEVRYWESLPSSVFQNQRVWLKLWGQPGILLKP